MRRLAGNEREPIRRGHWKWTFDFLAVARLVADRAEAARLARAVVVGPYSTPRSSSRAFSILRSRVSDLLALSMARTCSRLWLYARRS